MAILRPALGVLGGMGPLATADFLARLVRWTPAADDQDHWSVIVHSDPSTPSRPEAILRDGKSPLPAMLRGIAFLNDAGCSLIAVPCVTAHHWYTELTEASSVPVVSMVDATEQRLLIHDSRLRTVGVLATEATIAADVFASRLTRIGLDVVDLGDLGAENPVPQAIKALKSGDADLARGLAMQGMRKLEGRGADIIVVACTDLSAALSADQTAGSTPVLDASDCLAQECVAQLTNLE